ncbi:reverse transcriptase domain-containing protein [Tanacetum coccineum]
MVTPVEKRSSNKFYDFHNDKGYSTDECMQLKKQIKELVRAGKLSYLIKEIKQGRDQPKVGKKEVPTKDKSMAIYMIQPWHRMTRQKVTQSFERVSEITFPSLTTSSGTEGPLVIEAEIGGHMIHCMYVDGDHSTRAWMNFMIIRSLSPYNGIIGRPRIREIQAVPSTAHRMLKFPVDGGIVTIHSTILISTECAIVITSSKEIPKEARVRHENFKVEKLGHIRMATVRYDRSTTINSETSTQYPGRVFACLTKEKGPGLGAYESHPSGGYHQIQMVESDEEKMAFHTSQKVYCYTKMPFGLKNAGATYQRLVDKAFDSQVGRNIEVYIDDLVIESHTEAEMLRDIDETFRMLRKINMKLSPKKCTFGAVEGMFMGYMISPEWIKPCPDKTEVVLQLPSPQTIKEVQSLNGKLASLNRFLSKSVERSLPLFKTLKKCIKKSDFHWTPEAEQAFKQLKQHLSELPLLVAPKPKEELIVYLSATHGAISAVLMTKRGTVQTPVYFISRTLQGLELNYTLMEKLVLSLVFAAKRLWRYFQAHPIAVVTDQAIKQIISRLDVTGRLQKWSVMLGEHNITYRPRMSVKGQILADFLIEKPDESPSDTSVSTYALRFQFTASNNEAEYEALIAGLRVTTQMGVCNIHVSVDSKLVANQVLGAYVAKEENMIKYLEKVKSLVSCFTNFSISQVPRSKNKIADALSKIASTSFAHLSIQVLVEILKEKTIQEKEVTTVVEEDGSTWMTPIIEYLKEWTLPDDRKEASKLRIKARQYELLEGILYRRSFLKSWLRCVRPLQADYVIREIHEGSCSMHAGPRSVVAKAMRLGYYWPTMHPDAREMIRTCNDCQIHRPMPRNPQQPLTPITAPWPFYKWGINIAGPFTEGPEKVKFLIVVMDYFMKWIEAKAVATITGNRVKKFVWDNIICCFGLPGEIVSDNSKQFSLPQFIICIA